MSKGWHDVHLGDLIEIKHGFAFKGFFFRNEPYGDVLLTPGNFAVGGGFKDDKVKYYDGPVPEDFVLHEGDLLVTMTDLSKQSDTLGYPAFIPTNSDGRRYLHNQRLGRIVIKNNKETDLGYIYYLMCSRAYRNEVLASATGTTVKHTSPDRIKQFQFSLPPISEQRAIAHILGALDDKIELNRRMNQTLEEMARALFKSWFIDFDPVRAKMEGREPDLPPEVWSLFPERMVDSELGEVPEGWRVKALGEVASVSSGKRPRHRYPVVDGTVQIPLWGANGPIAFVSEPLVSSPVLLTGRVGTLGSVFRITEPCWPSDNTLIVSAKSSQFHNLLFFQMQGFDFNSLNRGSTQPLLTQSDLKAQLVIAPLEGTLKHFHSLTMRLFGSGDSRNRESRTLAAQRDALLPQLVSGQLQANNVERHITGMD